MSTPRTRGEGAAQRAERPLPRIVIEAVEPEIDAGRFPVKRVVGDALDLRASIFTDATPRTPSAW
jgi:starch synthase (maltosyl-transferring)